MLYFSPKIITIRREFDILINCYLNINNKYAKH